jgi:lipoprotein-anchoring transpeptidase ErfK/SrfK
VVTARWRNPLVIAFIILISTGACGGNAEQGAPRSATSAATHVTTAAYRDSNLVAQAEVSRVEVRRNPDDPAVMRVLDNPTENGGPLVFPVRRQEGDWIEVDLPVRPNGSTGWIRAGDVVLSQHDFRIVIELGAHRITAYRGEEVILQEPVGVGRANTPTPGGRFYVKELLKPPNPNTVYGPYAYGLSGFSNVLTSFAGGPGVIGIHGNNDPSSLGRDVSSGCIRMSNEGISRLSKILPLGTPVEIRP